MSFIYGNIQIVDLIISDVFFPTEDGLLILQEVTSKFDIPTVSKFLSSCSLFFNLLVVAP
jgi:response regulator of citrate/malate metabolism